MKLLENPLVKLIGIVAVLYFALFANKSNPDSLGNRLAPARIKQNLDEMQDKGKFIATNVKMARSLAKEQGAATTANKEEIKVEDSAKVEITARDSDLGVGQKTAECGSEVSAFVILNASGKNLDAKGATKFLIGSKKNWLIEKNIIGMKKNGVRMVNIPKDFKADEAELISALRESNSDLIYQIILQDITKDPAPKSNLNCQ